MVPVFGNKSLRVTRYTRSSKLPFYFPDTPLLTATKKKYSKEKEKTSPIDRLPLQIFYYYHYYYRN